MGDVEELLEQRKSLVDMIIDAKLLIQEHRNNPALGHKIKRLERDIAISRNVVEAIDETLYGAPPGRVTH